MTKKFTHKTAIVTGAGQGIGFEIARQLALHGASVLLNDIDEKLAKNASLNLNMWRGHSCPRTALWRGHSCPRIADCALFAGLKWG